ARWGPAESRPWLVWPVLARGGDPQEPPAVLARGGDPQEPPAVLAPGGDPPEPPAGPEWWTTGNSWTEGWVGDAGRGRSEFAGGGARPSGSNAARDDWPAPARSGLAVTGRLRSAGPNPVRG